MKKKVYQIKDGIVVAEYESISDAAKHFNVDESTIRKAAKRGKRACGFYWTFIPLSKQETTKPKILILDIETSPLLAYVWQKQVWKARIDNDKIISDWFILTFSCKWLGEDKTYSFRLTGSEAVNEDDSRLVLELWKFLSMADIVIAHNCDCFDIPNIRTRFIINGLPPTSYYKQIDTLKIVQKEFGFTYNNLDAIAKYFGIEGKISTNFDLWKRCIWGHNDALEEMEIYNRRDVEVLENVYLRLRPWIKSHANISLYNDNDDPQCAHCGSLNIVPNGSFYYTNTGKYPTYVCQECGAILRERKTVVSKSKNVLVSIPGR